MVFSRDQVVFSVTNAAWDGRLTHVFGEAAAHTDTCSFTRWIAPRPAGG